MGIIALIMNFAQDYYEVIKSVNNDNGSYTPKHRPCKLIKQRGGSFPNKYMSENYARNHHDKYNTNKETRICQKGLEERIKNKKLKEEKAEEERMIKDAFSRDIKSRRWAKRHHKGNEQFEYCNKN